MTQVKAILFDLDGTLVDSARDLQEATNRLLSEEGLRQVGLDEVKSMIGDGVAKLVERALAATGGDIARHPHCLTRFLEIYETDPTRYTRVYPEVPATLEGLRRRGLTMAVVTNKPHSATIAILGSLGLQGMFGTVIGGDTLPQRKPHPAPLLLAMERLHATPQVALMVGDNYHDVKAAHAAGIRAVAVTYGYSHKPHAELGADRLIDRMSELPQAIEGLSAG